MNSQLDLEQVKHRIKIEREAFRERRGILEAVLVSAAYGEFRKLPTIQEFILSELVNGVISHTGGNTGKITYRRAGISPSGIEGSNFERSMRQYLEEETSDRKGKIKISPKIWGTIDTITDYWIVFPSGPSDTYPVCELYQHFKPFFGGGICEFGLQSSFSFPEATVRKVDEEVLPSMSEHEKADIRGIGEAMKPFVKEDLEYISSTYHW